MNFYMKMEAFDILFLKSKAAIHCGSHYHYLRPLNNCDETKHARIQRGTGGPDPSPAKIQSNRVS